MIQGGSYIKRRWKEWLLAVFTLVFVFAIDRLLKAYYYSKTYSHYQVGEVYWEDSKTALFFAPDRYLFWRYKPNIRIKLTTPTEEYGLYHIGPRSIPRRMTITTNSKGYRAANFDCSKPPNTFRIFNLGDSRTMGEGVVQDERYSERLERLLNSASDGLEYEVINVGTDGYSSYQGRVLLERELIECQPDLVTVMFGVNDQDWDENIRDVDKAKLFDSPRVTLSQWTNRSMLVYFIRFQTLQIKGSLFGKTRRIPTLETSPVGKTRKVPLDDYEFNLNTIRDLGKAHGFQTLYLIVPNSPYSYYRALYPLAPKEAHDPITRALAMEKRGDYEGCTEVLEQLLEAHGDVALARHQVARCYQHLERWQEAHDHFIRKNDHIIFASYENVVRQFTEQKKAPLVDLTAEFIEMRTESLYVDDLHPNSLGNEIIAHAIFAKMQEQ